MALSLLFFLDSNQYLILFVQIILSHFSKFKMVVAMSRLFFAGNFFPNQKKQQSHHNKVVLHLWSQAMSARRLWFALCL